MSTSASAFPVTTLALLGLVLACGSSNEPEAGPPRQAPLIEAVEARFGALPIEETVPGVVRARNQVAIRPETAGRIVSVLAQIGDTVERGQLLVRLDDSEARDRLRQAEAEVRLAEAGAEAARARLAEVEARVARTRALAEQQLVSAQEMESLEAQLAALRASAAEDAARVEQRQAAVEENRSALGKTEVRAPVAGQLGERRAEIGMRADPSSVLFVVGDLDQLIVEVNLTETMLSRVREGLPVVIEGGQDAPGPPVTAKLSRISPFLAEQSFTAVGEIDVDNRAVEAAGAAASAGDSARRLRPGMFVTVRILVGESRQATLVPVSAIWEEPGTGERGVFVVEDDAGLEAPTGVSTESPEESRAVAFRRVEVLAEGPAAAGVTGIDEGDWVVIVGQQLLDAEARAGANGSTAAAITARVRPASWQRILALQDLQDEDLLEGFLDKQRKIAAALGAEIPESEDAVDRVLEAAQSEPAPSGGR